MTVCLPSRVSSSLVFSRPASYINTPKVCHEISWQLLMENGIKLRKKTTDFAIL